VRIVVSSGVLKTNQRPTPNATRQLDTLGVGGWDWELTPERARDSVPAGLAGNSGSCRTSWLNDGRLSVGFELRVSREIEGPKGLAWRAVSPREIKEE
jgi:hypothetical protein